MFLLLAGGAVVALIRDPSLLTAIGRLKFELRLPNFALDSMTWSEMVVGTLFLALPQVPLTLGNAIIAITDENNRLFPERPVSERKVAISTGLMNLGSAVVGGVPLCHGAGGMAGHIAFGARTGGAPILLGSLLLLLALFLSSSIGMVFRMVPPEVLGVILFLAGAQLALGSCDFSKDKGERFATGRLSCLQTTLDPRLSRLCSSSEGQSVRDLGHRRGLRHQPRADAPHAAGHGHHLVAGDWCRHLRVLSRKQ